MNDSDSLDLGLDLDAAEELLNSASAKPDCGCGGASTDDLSQAWGALGSPGGCDELSMLEGSLLQGDLDLLEFGSGSLPSPDELMAELDLLEPLAGDGDGESKGLEGLMALLRANPGLQITLGVKN